MKTKTPHKIKVGDLCYLPVGARLDYYFGGHPITSSLTAIPGLCICSAANPGLSEYNIYPLYGCACSYDYVRVKKKFLFKFHEKESSF